MDSGGYLNDTSSTPYEETPNRGKSQYTHRERGGLIPITAHILHSSTVTQDETVEYREVQLGDIIIVGYVTDYKEFEARVKVTIWDQTGSIDVTFYNNTENQDNTGLNGFYWDGKKKVVKIFGTVKVYKKEKNVQGAKIVLLKDNDIFHHSLQVINSWLYLTGRIQELKKGSYQNDIGNARDIAKNARNVNSNFNNNNNNNYNYGNNNNYSNFNNGNPFEIAQNILNDISRKGTKNLKKGELNGILNKKIRSDAVQGVIKNLLDEGFIMEDGDENFIIC
jgi:hypothetical protein